MTDNNWPPRNAGGDPWNGPAGNPPNAGSAPNNPPGVPHSQPGASQPSPPAPGYGQQQPGYGQQPASPTQGGYNQPPTGTTAPVGGPPAKKRRTGLLVGVVAVVLLLVGGGVFALTRFLSPSVDVAAAAAMPDNVIAYVQVDLDPSGDQKVKALSVLDKLPVDQGKVKDDPASLMEPLLKESGVDYQTEVKPWLGGTAAIGVVDSHSPIVVVATKDKAKAEEFAKKHSENMNYFFAGNNLVMMSKTANSTETQKKVESGGTLDKKKGFAEAMTKLGDSGIVSYWAEAGAVQKALGNSINTGSAPQLSGFLAGALRFDDNALELHQIMYGADPAKMPKLEHNLDRAGKLPGDSMFAIGLADGGKYFDLIKPLLTEGGLQRQLDSFGITEDDLRTIFGSTLLVAGNVNPQSPPHNPEDLKAGISIQGDSAKIKELVDRIKSRSNMPLVAVTDGDVVNVALTQSYAESMTKGDLGKNPKFTKTVGKSGSVQSLVYVDLTSLTQLMTGSVPSEYRDFIRSLESVGVTSSTPAAGESVTNLRVTFTD